MGEYLTRCVLGYLAIIATAAILSMLGIGNAKAGGTCPSVQVYNPGPYPYSTGNYPTQEVAYSWCAGSTPSEANIGGYMRDFLGCVKVNTTSYRQRWKIKSCEANNQGLEGYHFDSATFVQCPVGTEWNETTKTCFNADQCLARNADLGSNRLNPRPSFHTSQCKAGCEFAMQPPFTTHANTPTTVGTRTIYRGVMEYTGNPCAPEGAPDPQAPEREPDAPPKQECTPAGNGQTMCVKDNGDSCYTASTGRQICWDQGETGVKDDGPVKQKRDPGPDAIPPDLNLPNGDTLTPQGPPVVTNTTGPNVNITTNVTNYTTGSGANAGNKNSGEPNGGSGSGEGEGDGDGTAAGGTDCDTPPITSGDAVTGMVATQAWATRCAVEAGNAASVTGDVGNCAQPFTVEGTTANAIKLRGLRASICGDDADGNNRPDYLDEDGSPGGNSESGVGLEGEGDTTFAVEGAEAGGDGLDDAGMGFTRSCPSMPSVNVFGTSVVFDNSVMCDWLRLGGQFVLMLAALMSIRIMSSGA